MTTTRSAPAIATGLLLASLAARVAAGPINPPAGPVSPTYMTLAEIEPRIAINAKNTPGTTYILYRITSPGSYLLTSNIVVPDGKTAIEIASSNVTLDLNGFTIQGSAAGSNAIRTSPGAALSRVRLRNGSIINTVDAVRLESDTSDVRDLIVHNASAAGMIIQSGRVSDCQVFGSAGVGIEVTADGIVERCVSSENLSSGFRVGAGSLIDSCVANGNAGVGIEIGDASKVFGCVLAGNISGGIVAGSTCTIAECISSSAGGSGISVGAGSTVANCDVRTSSVAGILASSESVIRGNTCHANTTGIQVNGSNGRIEDNTCTGGSTGMIVTGSSNTISRNVCSLNAILNWSIAGGNKCLVVVGINAAPISGDSGGTGPGSTHPLANYTN
jgi:hypothetical protein